MGRTLYRAAVLADSPIAFWEGQETSGSTLVDSISAANMTTTGTVAQTGPMSDRAVLQPGGTSSARALVSNETTTMTMEIIAVFSAVTAGASNQTLYYNGSSGGDGYGLIVGTGGSFAIKGLLGGVAVGSLIGTGTGNYDHIVQRRNAAGAWSFFLNGVNGGDSGLGSTNPGVPTGNITIGGSTNFQFNWAYAAFYSTDLSDARILAHYTAIGTADPSPNQVLTPPPVRVFSSA